MNAICKVEIGTRVWYNLNRTYNPKRMEYDSAEYFDTLELAEKSNGDEPVEYFLDNSKIMLRK